MNQIALEFDVHTDTQEGVVLEMLRRLHIVTNKDLKEAGISHIARNRISDLRRKGYVIAQKGFGQGESWLENAYRLVWYPGDHLDPAVEDKLREEGWWIRPQEWKKHSKGKGEHHA